MELADADLATVGRAIGDANRARFLLALLGGQELSAGELASRAGTSSSLASAHLTKLLDAGLITAVKQGRNRHYSLANPQVARCVEGLLTIAPHRPASGLTEVNAGQALRRARTCYDHLAGRLGVRVTHALIDTGALAPADSITHTRRRPGDRLSSQLPEHRYTLSPQAPQTLASRGVPAGQLSENGSSRRPLLRPSPGPGPARRLRPNDLGSSATI